MPNVRFSLFFSVHCTLWLCFAALCLFWQLDEVVSNDVRRSLMLIDCASLALVSLLIRYLFIHGLLGRQRALLISVPVVLIAAVTLVWFSHSMAQWTLNYYFPNAFIFDLHLRDRTQLHLLANFTWPLILWFTGYLVAVKQLEQQRLLLENLELNVALSQAQLNTLKGQINPHFAFNALNNIRSLILIDPPQAREMLTHLAEMLRYSLNANKQDKVSIGEELVMVNDFIALSKIQFAERLTVEFELAKAIEHYLVPPMMLQILAENALKHGISHLNDGGTLRIGIAEQADSLIFNVENPVPQQCKAVASTQLGLENIRKRLMLLYPQNAELKISQSDGLFSAQVILPKEVSL